MEITGKTNLKSKHLEEADFKNLQLCFKIQKQSRLCKDNLTEGPVPHVHPHPCHTHRSWSSRYTGMEHLFRNRTCSSMSSASQVLHVPACQQDTPNASGVPQMSLGHQALLELRNGVRCAEMSMLRKHRPGRQLRSGQREHRVTA